MSDSQTMESLDWHFAIGNDRLTAAQFGEHQERGACAQCDELAGSALAGCGAGVRGEGGAP